jgi:TIR domain
MRYGSVPTSASTAGPYACPMSPDDHGHAFISYVREDSERVARLQAILEGAGVRVWRDTSNLWPGEDWRARIRDAITGDALAFIACFSHNSEARQRSGQNEELVLAVDQLRLRRPSQPWLIPVRFDDCKIPDLDLGGGRTLNSIQRVDLVSEIWDTGVARLIATVLRILHQSALQAPVARNVEILHADYGGVDVTSAVRLRVLNGMLQLRVHSHVFGIQDPARGIVKTLAVKYAVGGVERLAIARSGEVLHLPEL